MATIQVDGSISVKELRKRFKEAIGLSLRVFVGKQIGKEAVKAEDKQKLLEFADEKKIKKINSLEVTQGMTAGDFEKYFLDTLGFAVQIADAPNRKPITNDALLLPPVDMPAQGLY